jgi:smad nuclear-interacting protein 1
MPRRSPSPDSFKNHRDSIDGDTYRSRRDDPSRHRRSADPELRSGPRDRRGGVPERDTQRRAYYDDDRRRRGGDGDGYHRWGSRRRDGYDSHDDRRQRRDEDKDGRYVSRHGEGANQDHRSPRPRPRPAQDMEQHRPTDRGEPHDRRGRDDDARRDPPRRRSASPRRSRPLSRSRPHSRDRDRDRSRSESPAPTPAPEDKGKPNFAASGLLAAATNTVKNSDGTSTLLKYNEPPEARKPLVGWRLYVFKGDEQVGASLPSLSPCRFL